MNQHSTAAGLRLLMDAANRRTRHIAAQVAAVLAPSSDIHREVERAYTRAVVMGHAMYRSPPLPAAQENT